MSHAPGRILLIDDDGHVLRAYQRILAAAGHEVVTASDPRVGVSLLDEQSFDAVLSDIAMPRLNGLQLLREVRAHHLDLPVVLMTAAASIDSAARAVEYGAFRYLLKPIDREQLLRTIDDAIQLGRLAAIKREAIVHFDAHGARAAADLAGREASFEAAVAGLFVVYQPIVSWSQQRIYAHEALLRTTDRTFPDPGALLAAAEHLGRLFQVGRSVRAQVAATMAGAAPDATFFVNLHPLDLLDDELVDPRAPLTRFARRVVLEVTERAALDDVAELAERIAALRVAGFRLALDDLGAGYAGLSSFVLLHPEVVKLDMSLVRGLDQDRTKQRLVATMTELCQGMGLTVIAEGVETAAERDALLALHCDLLQGYLFARPSTYPPSIRW